jgi:LmbE family N-acetylglucosaminyl deacetylase
MKILMVVAHPDDVDFGARAAQLRPGSQKVTKLFIV